MSEENTDAHAARSLSVGASTDIGRRPTQQDDYLVVASLFPDSDIEPCACFGVFDGHGNDGEKAAMFVKNTLPDWLQRRRDAFHADRKGTLVTLFRNMNDALCEDSRIDTYMSGTTAAVVFVWTSSRRLTVAHVGDSRVLAAWRNPDGTYRTEQITMDHNCNVPEEMNRVVAAGARVDRLYVDEGHLGPYRIFKGSLPYPGLVVTRALGDSVAKRLGVLPDPDVVEIDITPNLAFVVIGSDGVFEGLTNEEAIEIVARHQDPQKASEDLTHESLAAMERIEIDDNTTNIVLRFA